MRAKEFLTEAATREGSLSGKEIHMVAQKAFNKIYPGVKLHWNEDDSVNLSTSLYKLGAPHGQTNDLAARTGERLDTSTSVDAKFKIGEKVKTGHGNIVTIVKDLGYHEKLFSLAYQTKDNKGDLHVYREWDLQKMPNQNAQDNIDIEDDEESIHDAFNLMLHVNAIDGGIDVKVNWAYAGKFKGVTTPILGAIFKLAEKKFGKQPKTLVVDDDRSDGVWIKIADKLGVEYLNDV